MPHAMPVILALAFGGLALIACRNSGQTTPSPMSAEAPLSGTEWELVELDGKPAPPGAGGKPATLILATDGSAASGFAGCNRMSGRYEAGEAALRFGPIATTRMACETGMELELRYLALLEATRTYRRTARGLELVGDEGVLALFRIEGEP